jgi:hypothetical protein
VQDHITDAQERESGGVIPLRARVGWLGAERLDVDAESRARSRVTRATWLTPRTKAMMASRERGVLPERGRAIGPFRKVEDAEASEEP